MTILFREKSFSLKLPGMRKEKRNSKFILKLESNRGGKTCVRRLFDSHGKIIVNSQLILGELRSFYQNLYSNQDSQDIDDICTEFLDNMNMPKVSEDTKLLCDGQLSTEECYNALLKFSSGKSPGNDGLTVEFY